MRKNRYTLPIIMLILSIITYFTADILSSFRGRSSIDYKLLPLNTTITWEGYNLYSFIPINYDDRRTFYEKGLPISVYTSDDTLDTIHFKTIVEYGIRKDRLVFHIKDIDDIDIYILRAKNKLDANIIRDYVITTDDFIHNEYHWINLQEINMPWMKNVLMYYLGVFGIIVSLLWVLFLLFRKIQSRKKEYVILIVTFLVSSICYLSIDICYFSYKGASMESYDYLLPFNTHIYCLGGRYSFEWIGGNYSEFMSEGLPINVIAENGEVQTINQKTVLKYGFKRKELVYQIESIEGDRYYIQKVDRNNDYLIAEEDFNYDDYRWKDFERNTTYRVLGFVMFLGFLVAIVSAALLAIYLITAPPLHKK